LEIKFLRKNLSFKIAEFAKMLGVDRVSVSRWENGHEEPAKSTERLIRTTYAIIKHAPEPILDKLAKLFGEDWEKISQSYKIKMPSDEQDVCRVIL
jgi:transcriptional regulator with XRE-family HTH domain